MEKSVTDKKGRFLVQDPYRPTQSVRPRVMLEAVGAHNPRKRVGHVLGLILACLPSYHAQRQPKPDQGEEGLSVRLHAALQRQQLSVHTIVQSTARTSRHVLHEVGREACASCS